MERMFDMHKAPLGGETFLKNVFVARKEVHMLLKHLP